MNKFAMTPFVTAEAIRILESNLLVSRRILPWDGPPPWPSLPRQAQPGDGIVPFDENGLIEPDDDEDDDD